MSPVMEDMAFYIYRHIRPDTNEVFYIGKGFANNKSHSIRYKEKKGRNRWWNSVVAKNGGIFHTEIIYWCLTENEANAKEREFIAIYGRRDLGNGTLVNLTDGGDGSAGIIMSDETRRKLSVLWTGENHPNFGKKLSQETCDKKSKSMKESPKSLKGKKLPDWWVEKIRQTKFGEDNPMYGKPSPHAKKVIDTETGVVYGSIMESAKSTPYQFQYVSAMLNGTKPNKTNLRYL